MGTTAEKLTYLNTTKGKIKDSINLTGAGITTEPFRQYAVKLKDAYVDIINNGTETLYNNFPKVSGSGTDLSLQNTYEAPMRSTLKGNTSQVQLSGKNLFNIDEYTNAILRGGGNAVSLTKEDDTTLKTLNKVSQTQNYCLIPIPNSDNLLGKTITISGNASLNNVSGTTINIYFISGTSYVGSSIFSKTITSNGVFTLTGTIPSEYPSGAIRLALGIYGSGSTTQPVNSYVLWKNLQIEESSTATTYEQYCGGTPSPNPSYPQDIHNVSGNNSVVVCGKNLFNKDNPNIISEYYLNDNGVEISNSNFSISDYISVIPNTIYSIAPYRTHTACLCFYDISKTFISSIQLRNIENNNITTPSNCYYIKTSFRYDVASELQIELGSTATTYEAYNGTTYPINLGSIELCKIGTYQDYIYKEDDKWYLHKETIKIEVDQNSEGWITDTIPSGNPRHFIRKSTHNYDIKTPPDNNTLVEGYANVGIVSATNTSSGVKNGVAVHPNGSIYCDNGTYNNLSNTPIILEVVLNTPTNTEITDSTLLSQLEAIYNAKSKNGTTNINQENNDLAFILTASALEKE